MMKVLILFVMVAATCFASLTRKTSDNIPYQIFEPNNSIDDGDLDSQRIINGLTDIRGDTPYYVYIRGQRNDASSVYCGGVLLSWDRVLTAASCILPAVTATLSFGAFSRENLNEAGRENRQINDEDFIVNIDPDLPDLAIIRVHPRIEPSQFISTIRFARAADEFDLENLAVIVSGYGRYVTGSTDRSPFLRYVVGTVRPESQCTHPVGTTSQVFCVEASDGAETAYGDGGSPAVVINANGEPVLVGIATEKPESVIRDNEVFSSFTSVAPYSDWISFNLITWKKDNYH